MITVSPNKTKTSVNEKIDSKKNGGECSNSGSISMNRSKSCGRRDARPRDQRQNKLTVAVLGAERVGKSAIVSQFLWGKFVPEYRPTVEEFNWIEYEVEEGRVLMVQIIDSSGSRDFLGMRNLYIGTADAFMVVFSVNEKSSYEEAISTLAEIASRRGRTTPVVLVANKTDLECSFDYDCTIPLPIDCCAQKLDEVRFCFQELLSQIGPNSNIQGGGLRKRRQSMPSSRGYSGVEARDIAKIKTSRQKEHCCIS